MNIRYPIYEGVYRILTEKEVRPECQGGRDCHGRVKIEVRADRYPSRTCGDET